VAFPDLFASVSRTEEPQLAGKWNSAWELLDYKTTLDAEAEGFEVPDLPLGNCATFASMLGSFIVCLDNRAYQAFKPFVEKDGFETLSAIFEGETVKVIHVRNFCPKEAIGPDVIARLSAWTGTIYVGDAVKQAIESAGVTGLTCARVDRKIN
jgi:hypothetical protein